MTSLKVGALVEGYPDRKWPAQGTYVYWMMQKLASSDTSIELVCARPWWELASNVFRDVSAELSDRADVLRTHYVAMPGVARYLPLARRFNQLAFSRSLAVKARKHLGAANVIYSHFLRPGVVGAELARERRLPFVMSLGESNIAKSVYVVGGASKARQATETASTVITVNSRIANYLKENLGLVDTKFEVLPNGIDVNAMASGRRAETRCSLGLDDSDFVVAFVGHREERKGVQLLDLALESLGASVKSLFVGEGYYKPAHSGALFCGPVPGTRVPDYLAAADVFVLPTRAEGSCNAILEAMAAGLPVITCPIPEVLDDIGSESAFFLPARTSTAIAEAIEFLRVDQAYRNRLVHTGKNIVSRRSIDDRAQRIWQILRDAQAGSLSAGKSPADALGRTEV